MSTLLNVPILSQRVLDQSGSYDVTLGAGSTLTIERDSATPTGDPVNVTFDHLSVTALSNIEVQHASLTVGALANVSALTSYTIGDGGRLEFDDAANARILAPIKFDGVGGILALDDARDLSLLGGITGFSSDDVISFNNVPSATDVRYENGSINVYNGSDRVASVAVTGSFDPADLGYQSNGHGGISVGDGLGNGGGLANDVYATGLHTEYEIARTPLGQLFLQDEVGGRDPSQTISGGQYVLFADGVGRFDATGVAEDVAHLYQAAFDRRPDASGLEYWTTRIESGELTSSSVAHSFTGSTEFQNAYAGLDNTGFINQLYENVLGRAGEASGVTYWLQQMANGEDRGDVLQGFATSLENVTNTLSFTGDNTYGHVYRLYEAALDRQPEGAGLEYWYDRLQGGEALSSVANGFIVSNEFQTNYGSLDNTAYVDRLYLNVLGRAADTAGEQYWTNALANGSTRADVLLGFSDSLENRVQTADATHDNWVFLGSS